MAVEGEMRDLWTAYETWLAEHWPEGLHALQGPATDAQIRALEERLNVALPDDYVACLKIHNGQVDCGPMLYGWEFLPAEEVAEQWAIWAELLDSETFDGISSEPQAGIKSDWWNRRWIPVTHDGGGNHLCLDLDPGVGGRSGQVITMWHDSAERERMADRFLGLFARYVQAVLAGQYVYSDDYGGIVDVSDA